MGLLSEKNKEVLLGPLSANNPVVVQMLGICSALAVTSKLEPAIVMGISVTAVVAFANVIISLMRNTIPNHIRIIVQLVVLAALVTIVSEVLKAFAYDVNKQLSVFVGLIISLGSSTVIGNIIAGLVITYMRPFKLGDRIQLNETTGNVIEKTPFVTRLRTPKNEVVTIPNSFIMSSHTTNYSVSARQYGLIIHSTVTIGYDVPWRQVHQLLINAARQTTGVLPEPKPFVLETELSDYYPCYQINAYIKDADKLGDIYSDLHQNIQDVFNEAGVEIMSPHYFAGRDGSASTIPTAPYPDDWVEPSKK